jgi:hypothetical protein
MTKTKLATLASVAVVTLGLSAGAHAQASAMTFFITSTGSGKGADFGGLAGADKLCQSLAAAVGAGSREWRAYLSTQGAQAVNARDRIGSGPWQNVKGVVVAKSVAELHGTNNLTKQTALTEKGEMVNGRGDSPNKHDILTGSQTDGTAFAGRASRPHGPERGAAREVLEFLASVARLQRRSTDRHRGSGVALLLRGQVVGSGLTPRAGRQ